MSLGDIAVNVVKFIVNIIEMVFRITFPIGWDELGVIATVSAVVVALVANKKASEQLKSALEMQEQSKNVSLLDKRVELAEAIQSGKSVSMLTLQVLFNDEIVKHYTILEKYLTEKVYADYDLERYYDKVKEPDGAGGFSTDVRSTLERYIANMSTPDCPQQVHDEYEQYCSEHIVYLPDGETGVSTPYNHSEITTRIGNATENIKKEHELAIQLIEKFIADSIQSLNIVQEKKRFSWKFWKRGS